MINEVTFEVDLDINDDVEMEEELKLVNQGVPGVGIDRIVFNADYTLTIYLTDGTSYTTESIRGATGATGNGIASAVLNADYTLTLTFTDGTSYTTGRLMPTLSIGTVTDLPAGSDPTASLSGTPANPVLNLGLPHGLSGNETIDDTAGIGDVDLVWSADKLKRITDSKAPVITDSASGSIASFPDGADDLPVKELNVEIEPVQDLHGYDHPWPAGGGKNLMPYKDGIDFTINGMRFYTDSGDLYIVGTTTNGISSSSSQFKSNFSVNLKAGTYTIRYGNLPSAIAPFRKKSDDSIITQMSGTFTLAEDTECYIGFYIPENITYNTKYEGQLESGSTDTYYAPYSNICPITGWTGAKVTRTGTNILPNDWEVGTIDNTTGQNDTDPNNIRIVGYVKILAGEQYYLYSEDTSVRYYWYDANKSFLSSDSEKNVVIIAPSNAAYLRIRTTASYGTTFKKDICVNYPATITTYQSPGTTIPITFPSEAGTVYGGTLTLNQDGTGTLVVDRGNVDLGTLNWSYWNTIFFANVSGKQNTRQACNIKCSHYPANASNFSNASHAAGNMADKQVAGFYKVSETSDSLVYAKDSAYTDSATFKSAMSGVMLVYELATPTTYDLTAPQVKTLLGLNHIWADTGDTEVTYCADTKLYIDRKITEAVANALNA